MQKFMAWLKPHLDQLRNKRNCAIGLHRWTTVQTKTGLGSVESHVCQTCGKQE